MKKLTPLLFAISLFACNRGEFRVVEIDSMAWRNGYPYVSVDTQQEAEAQQKWRDSIRNSKPQISSKEFEEIGLSRRGELITDNFQYENFQLKAKGLPDVGVSYYVNPKNGLSCLRFDNGKTTQSLEITNMSNGSPYGTYHADVIKGGYDEVIAFSQEYFMNGDNYTVHIYEIQTAD